MVYALAHLQQLDPMADERVSGPSIAHPSIAVVADVRLYREGLARALGARLELTVVCDVALGQEGIARLGLTQPDIVLLEAPSARLADVVSQLRAVVPAARVVAFALADEEHDAIRCAEAGASGYVSRDATIEELVTTILRVARGEFPCSPRVATLLARRLSVLAGRRPTPASGPDPQTLLTARERQILALIDDGLSNKEIAARLGIELSTVKNHVHHILDKTSATRRAQAAARLRAARPEGRRQSDGARL